MELACAGPEPLTVVMGVKALGRDRLPGLAALHHPGSEDEVKGLTHWVVTDVATPHGADLLKQVIGCSLVFLLMDHTCQLCSVMKQQQDSRSGHGSAWL